MSDMHSDCKYWVFKGICLGCCFSVKNKGRKLFNIFFADIIRPCKAYNSYILPLPWIDLRTSLAYNSAIIAILDARGPFVNIGTFTVSSMNFRTILPTDSRISRCYHSIYA